MFMPKTLSQAYALSHFQETTLKSLHQELNINPKRLPPLLSTPNTLPKLPPRNTFTSLNQYNRTQNNYTPNNLLVTNSKMRPSSDFDDRRTKGLCFWCDEKFVTDHKCSKKQLYVVEVNAKEVIEEEMIEEG